MSSSSEAQANVLHLYEFNFEAVFRYFQLQSDQTAVINAMRFVYKKAYEDQTKKGLSRAEASREAVKNTIEKVEFRYNLLSFIDNFLKKDPSDRDAIITATIIGEDSDRMSVSKNQKQYFDIKLIRDVKIINDETSEIMNGTRGDFWFHSMFFANIRSFELLKQLEADINTIPLDDLIEAQHETLGIIKSIADKKTDIGKHLRTCRSVLKKELDEKISQHASTAQDKSVDAQEEMLTNSIIAVPYPLTRNALSQPEPC